MTLREAIEQARSLGHDDPWAIADFVIAGHGEEIVLSEIDARAYAADIARRVLGASRRQSIGALARIEAAPKRDVMLSEAFVPGVGWVSYGKFTLDLWERLIGAYRKGAAALTRYADWADENRALQAEQGVQFFRQVKGALPALPPAEETA